MAKIVKQVNIEEIVSRVATAELSNLRRAGAKTKKRGEVSGGGKKPWRQKGTGRARAGSTRSPIWRGGGAAFGPTGLQNYTKTQNKKVKEAARKEAFASKKDNTVTIEYAKIAKTKDAYELLKKNNSLDRVLVLLSDSDRADYENLKRCFANIRDLRFSIESYASTLDILSARNVVILKKLVKKAPKPAEKVTK